VSCQNDIPHDYIETVKEEIKENVKILEKDQNMEFDFEDFQACSPISNEEDYDDTPSKFNDYSTNNHQNDNANDHPKENDPNFHSKSLNSESTDHFLSPMPISNKFQKMVLKDTSSNYNYYHKEFIPKIVKNSDNIKNKIAFLKKFKPKFIKRENIDKKITRNFRRYLIETRKKNLTLDNFDNCFWVKFIKENLLPPMKYSDAETGENIDFRSFNTNYMVWLFSKTEAKILYEEFISRRGLEIMNLLKEIAEEVGVIKENNESELAQIKSYIYSIADIYYMPEHVFSTNFSCATSACGEDSRLGTSVYSSRNFTKRIPTAIKNMNNMTFGEKEISTSNYYSNKPYEEYLGLGKECDFEVRENLFGGFR